MYGSAIIIDDSKLERFIAEAMIRSTGFARHIMSFGNPVEALAYLTSIKDDADKFPDVIFLDIQMPLLNGFEFLDKYLELPGDMKEHSKIVMFSSTTNDEDYARMQQYPIIRKFLVKPLSEETFRKLVL